MTPELRDRISLLVGFIWEAARKPGPDLTGLGLVRICEQNVEQLVRDVIAEERERCAKLVEGHGAHCAKYPEADYDAELICLHLAANIREGK